MSVAVEAPDFAGILHTLLEAAGVDYATACRVALIPDKDAPSKLAITVEYKDPTDRGTTTTEVREGKVRRVVTYRTLEKTVQV